MNIIDLVGWLLNFLLKSGALVVALLVGGSIILYIWRAAGRASERGGVMAWALMFRWLFAIGIGVSTLLFIWVLFNGAPVLTQWVFDQLAASRVAAEGIKLPPLDVTPNPNPPSFLPTLGPLPTSAGAGTPTHTPEPTLPPAPATTFFRQFDSSPIEVHLLPGVTQLTLYNWRNGTQTMVSGPYYACAITQFGWLVACPSGDLVVFSPNEVDIASVGITLPPSPTQAATATPLPSPTPNQTEAVSFCDTKFVMWSQGDISGVEGTNLVPNGITAELKGPGLVALLPGDQDWTITVTGLPTHPTLTVKGRLIESIDNRDSNGTIQFVGTGSQCQ